MVVVIFELRFFMGEAPESLVLTTQLRGVPTGGVAAVEVGLCVDDLAFETRAY